MRIVKNQKKRPIFFWLIAFASLALIAFGCLYWLKLGPFSIPSSDQDHPTAEEQSKQKETAANEKKEFAEANKDNDLPGAIIPPPSSPSTIELTPNKASGMLTIKTKLIGYSAGNCQLTITNGPKAIHQEAAIVYQPEFSTCAGFSVPLSDLGPGVWKVNLIVTPTGGSPITKSTEVTI